MATFTVILNKLLFELVPDFTKNIHSAKDIPDLQSATRVALNLVIDTIFPGHVASIKPKAQDPQEANKEENKDAPDFVEEVTNACKEFMDDKKVFES